MSYTNIDLVNRHINFEDYDAGLRKDYPLGFADTEWVELPGKFIADDSVTVKALLSNVPVYEELTLAESTVSLTNGDLVPSSATAASDKSLGTIFAESVDFSVNCSAGEFTRINGGSIASGDKVSVWYYQYKTYVENSDYQIDYQSGRIRVLDGGSILYNQDLLIDYQLSATQYGDEIIEQAVNEANAMISSEIDAAYQESADSTLQTAATYLAVSIVCRMAAATDLKRLSSSRYSSAPWIALADSYRVDYEKLISKFRPDRTRLSGPTRI